MLPGRDRIVSRAFPRGPALGWRVDLHSALLGRQRLYGRHSAVGRRASQRTCPRDRRGLLHVSPPPREAGARRTLLSTADAAAAERRIKGWSRAKKEAYIRGDYAVLIALAKRSGKRTLGPG